MPWRVTMIRPQAGLLRLRTLGVGVGPARPAAMKSATSLLLGAALATAFFLLYTSLCRDLGGAGPPGSPPQRWEREDKAIDTGAAAAGDREVRHLNHPKQQQEVDAAKQEEERKGVVTRSDGDGARADEKGRDNKQPQGQIVMPATSTPTQQEEDDLPELLRRAATADKTVLMTAINSAWAAPGSFLDLFLESFRHGEGTADLPKHLLIVSMDGNAHARCRAAHAFCYWLRVAGMDFAGEQKYMKGDYLEMMWRRNRLQRRVLELGYSFLFTDVDILWFRPPFPRLPGSADVVMSSDFFVGDPASPGNYPNGGLLYVRASPAAVAFYEQWEASRARFPGKHEQYVFDMIVKEGVPARIGATVRFLDTAVFGGFCQHGKDLGRVATMHANCCVGLENKLFDLRNVLQDWKAYRAMVAGGGGDARGFSWRVPGRCIH